MVPDFDAVDWPLAGVGAHQERRQRARADDQQIARVLARKVTRGEGGSGGGAPLGEPRSVEERQRLAGLARLQHIGPLHRGQS